MLCQNTAFYCHFIEDSSECSGLLLRTVCDHDQEDGSFEVRTKISISYYVLLVCLVYMTAGAGGGAVEALIDI